MTILKDSTDTALRALNGAKCVILDTEEAELLHLNSNVTIIKDQCLALLQFGGITPIVGTDYYVVGTCQAWGDWNTMICSKADIIAAQQSTGTPLVQSAAQATDSFESEIEPAVEGEEAATATPKAVRATTRSTSPTRGCFSGYVLN